MQALPWKQRFENYDRVLGRLSEALAAVSREPGNHLYVMASIHAFELAIKLGWKMLKDFLTYGGVQEVSFPRDVVKHAFHHQIITDGQTWIDMLEACN